MFGFLMRRRKRVRSDARVFFIALAVVLTLLLVGIVMQRTVTPRIGVGETPTSDVADAASALPDGIGNPAVAGIRPAVDPTYVYAYEHGDGVEAAAVQWSRHDGAYVMTSQLDAAKLGLTGASDPHVAPYVVGWDTVVAITAVTPGIDAASLVRFSGGTLTPLLITDEEGAVRPAIFGSGTDGDAYAEFRFEDLDGDGAMELIATSGTVRSPGGPDAKEDRTANVRVFRWNGSVLAYDAEASWAFSISDEVFPKPATDAADAGA